MRNIWRWYNDLSKPRSPDSKEKKIIYGEESGPRETQIIAAQLKQKMLRALTLMIYSWTPETRTHTHTEQSVTDWIRPRVCVLTALSRYYLSKGIMCPLMCATLTTGITKAADLYGPETIWVFKYSQKRWLIRARPERLNLRGNEADFKLFQAVKRKT